MEFSGRAAMNESTARLFQAMIERGYISDEQPMGVARCLNISPSVVSNFKRRGPSKDILLECQKNLNINAIWVLDGTGPMFIDGWTSTYRGTQQTAQVLHDSGAEASNFVKAYQSAPSPNRLVVDMALGMDPADNTRLAPVRLAVDHAIANASLFFHKPSASARA